MRLALLALALLALAAAVGMASGSRRAKPGDAQPRTPMLDVSTFRSVELLPPERRTPWLDGAQFEREPAPDPRASRPRPAAAGPDEAEAVPAPAGARRYRVRENDTMTKIAQREYGDASLADWLIEVNRIKDPTKLGIGDPLLLPPAPAPEERAGRRAAAAAAPPQPPSQPQSQQVRTVVVAKNETLGEIAQREYGSVRYAEALMKANGLKRPQDLKAGQTLVLPKL